MPGVGGGGWGVGRAPGAAASTASEGMLKMSGSGRCGSYQPLLGRIRAGVRAASVGLLR